MAERWGLVPPPALMPVRSDEMLVRDGLMRVGLGTGACQHRLAAIAPNLERVLPEVEVIRLSVWLVAHDDLRRSRSLRALHDAPAGDLARMFEDAGRSWETKRQL